MGQLREVLLQSGFMSGPGAHVIVDGQFGSTGKGLLASVVAEELGDMIDHVTCNAGPNSGHTAYHGDHKIVLRQLPTAAVMVRRFWKKPVPVSMNAGAILDIEELNNEIELHALNYGDRVMVSPFAAVVGDGDKSTEKTLVSSVGSTGKGTGAALARKVLRDHTAVAGWHENVTKMHRQVVLGDYKYNKGDRVLVEVSQGFSLSLNAGGFYPYSTSRDCTVAQALSDAGIHPIHFRSAAMVVRTFPIRVAGNSGPGYEDQRETDWESMGVEPELTTVTKKVRRIFTWSKEQFMRATAVNRPSVVFVNFINYLKPGVDHDEWLKENVVGPYRSVMGHDPVVLLGYGAKNSDVRAWE